MARKWRVRFMARRLCGLADAPRPRGPRKITDEQVEVLVTRTLTEKGRGRINEWNKNPKPFIWTKSAVEILETIAEYCQRIVDSGY